VSNTAAIDSPCDFCRADGGEVVWRDDFCRVVIVGDKDYPGFCRVVLNRHVREMTDLPEDERARLMRVVFAVEAAVRELLAPDKVNLASLGNVVPHLHWHVIPRFRGDRHFPAPIWAAAARAASVAPALDPSGLRERLAALC
jgi:diadenosine tetraphosphate (Ap4A) HIT family hydrolase